MFCPKCGKEIAYDSKHCSACGAMISESAKSAVEKKMSGFAISGFIVSLVGLIVFGMVCGFAGVILSLVALKMISKDDALKGNGLAISGLAISIIDIVASIIFINII